jgi:hypothetical protein
MALTTIPTHPDANSYVSVDYADDYFLDRGDFPGWLEKTTVQKEALLKRATREIDSMSFYGYAHYYRARDYRAKQALAFPRNLGFSSWTFTATGTSSTTVTTGNFQGNESYYDDFCKGYALIVTDGTGKGQTREVSAYDNNTGTITVSEAFATTPDTDSRYLLIMEVPDDVKYATCEQARFIDELGRNRAAVSAAKGVKRRKIDDLEEEYFSPNESSRSEQDISISSSALAYLQGYLSFIS